MAALWATASVCHAAALLQAPTRVQTPFFRGMQPLADAVITEALRAMREKDTVTSVDPFPSPMYVG